MSGPDRHKPTAVDSKHIRRACQHRNYKQRETERQNQRGYHEFSPPAQKTAEQVRRLTAVSNALRRLSSARSEKKNRLNQNADAPSLLHYSRRRQKRKARRGQSKRSANAFSYAEYVFASKQTIVTRSRQDSGLAVKYSANVFATIAAARSRGK